MSKFISQTDLSLKRKKKRWTPKGRQSDSKSVEEINSVLLQLKFPVLLSIITKSLPVP